MSNSLLPSTSTNKSQFPFGEIQEMGDSLADRRNLWLLHSAGNYYQAQGHFNAFSYPSEIN